MALDPSHRGPLLTSTAQYKFPATQDDEVLPLSETELWARVFWPRDLSRPIPDRVPYPILFFLHGNHATCGTGSNPRVDASCEYTSYGSCPSGSTVAPSHEGYNYLADHLASYGFIVVSINANRGINCGNGNSADSGLNLARGRLILRHMQKWMKWSIEGGAPASMKIPANAFIGAIDFSRVGLLGHSRGGEGARAAYNLYRDPGSLWKNRIPGLHISGIYEVGAVDGQTSRTLDADDIPWNQLLPMCDGDVSDLQGRLPFERMILKSHEQVKNAKSLYMVWGANHNFFNTEWQVSDSASCTGHTPIFGDGPRSLAQQKIALVSATSFFVSHVGQITDGNSLASHFDPSVPLPQSVTSITRITRDQIPTFDELFDARIEEFTEPTGTGSRHNPNLANGITIVHGGYTPRRASISWTAAGPDHFSQFNMTPGGGGFSVDGYANLDFRVMRQSSYIGSTTPTNFSVALIDPQDRVLASVRTQDFAEILGPATYQAIFQTVRIPLAAFHLPPGAPVHGVRFIFDQSTSGAIEVANIRLSRPASLPTPLKLTSTNVENFNPPPSASASLAPLIPQENFAAELLASKYVNQSTYLNGSAAIELSIRSAAPFPAQDQLPLLLIEDHEFSISRYAEADRMNTLIFSIPRDTLKGLPEKGVMRVQYGKTSPKVWHLPDFEKSNFLSLIN